LRCFDVREPGVRMCAPQVQLLCSVVQSPCHEAVYRSDAGISDVVPQVGFDPPATEGVDPAVEARHDLYDVDGVHGGDGASPSTSACPARHPWSVEPRAT
jgi:hypothetical protein